MTPEDYTKAAAIITRHTMYRPTYLMVGAAFIDMPVTAVNPIMVRELEAADFVVHRIHCSNGWALVITYHPPPDQRRPTK